MKAETQKFYGARTKTPLKDGVFSCLMYATMAVQCSAGSHSSLCAVVNTPVSIPAVPAALCPQIDFPKGKSDFLVHLQIRVSLQTCSLSQAHISEDRQSLFFFEQNL
jgi:hypothetical protein